MTPQEFRDMVFSLDPQIPVDDMPVEDWLFVDVENPATFVHREDGGLEKEISIVLQDGRISVSTEVTKNGPGSTYNSADLSIWIWISGYDDYCMVRVSVYMKGNYSRSYSEEREVKKPERIPLTTAN